MVEPENIPNRAKRIIAERLKVSEDQIADDTNMARDLGMDSLAGVEIVMDLEEEFGVEIPDTDAERLTTFKQAIDYIQKKLTQEKKKEREKK